jgi:hypothetical protein
VHCIDPPGSAPHAEAHGFLPDGLVLRTARHGDLDQLATLLTGRGEAADAIDHRLIVDDPGSGLGSCAVVVDSNRVRPAGVADIPAMARLQDAAQREYDLRMPHSAACWRWLVARTGSSQVVVERAGRTVGTGRVTPPDEGVVLGEVAAAEPPAVAALLAYAAGLAGAGDLTVQERGAALDARLAQRPSAASMYYARVPDVAALLDHLRPVLSGRLAAAGLAAGSGEIVLSFFRHHVRLAYRDGAVTGVRTGGPMQAPGVVGGAGLAPDLVAPLLFGPHGIAGLAERHPDVYPGPNEALMWALFPPVSADILTLYLP